VVAEIYRLGKRPKIKHKKMNETDVEFFKKEIVKIRKGVAGGLVWVIILLIAGIILK
jgi:hypothetical protein